LLYCWLLLGWKRFECWQILRLPSGLLDRRFVDFCKVLSCLILFYLTFLECDPIGHHWEVLREVLEELAAGGLVENRIFLLLEVCGFHKGELLLS
jgi:hypothetical protein